MSMMDYLEYTKGFTKAKHDIIFQDDKKINEKLKNLKLEKIYDFGYADGIEYYKNETCGMSKEEIYVKFNNDTENISKITRKIYREKYDKKQDVEPLRGNYRGY